MRALFEYYPGFNKTIPIAKLGNFPTPVEKLPNLGKSIGLDNLYIKREDISGPDYGGNKLRKLEFLFGKAIEDKKKSVITFGAVGSNHALATSVYANKLGLKCAVIMMPQKNHDYVKKNLLAHAALGTELIEFDKNIPMPNQTLKLAKSLGKRYGSEPMIIPFGGTTPLGSLGTVNAAFELKKQALRVEMPEPDSIYVAFGSMGTAAGLILGLKAAGMKTEVHCISVVDSTWSNKERLVELLNGIGTLLCESDSAFPNIKAGDCAYDLTYEFFGEDYAIFTPKGIEALDLIKETENIDLDGTYTAKALSALIDHAGNGGLKDKTVLFWNTLNSVDISALTSKAEYQDLPEFCWRYFEV